jgi:cellulose biosynthesis protein BcsQ
MAGVFDPALFDRSALSRVLAVANGKGGVGKTTVSTHVSGLAAEAGYRVLLVDLDPQGNAGEDLGYSGAGLGDDGQGLVNAVVTGQPPVVLTAVRENLDVVPAGPQLDDLAGALDARRRREGPESALALARALATIAGNYDLVVLDCPPRHEVLQEAALVAAQWVVIPTKTDASSRKGLREMARRFTSAHETNPGLGLLGVLLFGVTTGATRIRDEARTMIEAELGGVAPVFEATVRHVEAAAYSIRSRGQLAHELERVVASGPKWYEALRDGGVKGPRLAASASSLAGDFQAVTEEILLRLTDLERTGATA